MVASAVPTTTRAVAAVKPAQWRSSRQRRTPCHRWRTARSMCSCVLRQSWRAWARLMTPRQCRRGEQPRQERMCVAVRHRAAPRVLVLHGGPELAWCKSPRRAYQAPGRSPQVWPTPCGRRRHARMRAAPAAICQHTRHVGELARHRPRALRRRKRAGSARKRSKLHAPLKASTDRSRPKRWLSAPQRLRPSLPQR